MATKKKTKSTLLRKVSIGLVAILLISFLFSFDGSASWLGDKIGQPAEKIKSIAKTVVLISLGLFLITTGVPALAIPVVGIALIVIGLILVGFGVWPLFKKKEEPDAIVVTNE